jgi:hypothetical protein
VSQDFLLLVFHESVSPQPQSIPLRPFRIFQKFAKIFAIQGAPPVSTTLAANFATSFASIVDTGGKFTTGVNDTGGKFATGVNIAGGKLPPLSTTPAANLSLVSFTPVANNGSDYQTSDNLK